MFNIPELSLEIYDIIGGRNLEHLEDFLRVYSEYLPQYIRYEPLMRQRAHQPVDVNALYHWHQWLVRQAGQPVAMLTFVLNRKRNMGIFLDFIVIPEARAIHYQGYTRMAGLLLALIWEQLKLDAQADGLPIPIGMIAEVGHISLVERYKQYGFVELPIEYYEPPYTPGLAEVIDPAELERQIGYRRLYPGVFVVPGGQFDPADPAMILRVVEMLLFDHYHLPPDHWIVRTAMQCYNRLETGG
jgi:hypothetical protein